MIFHKNRSPFLTMQTLASDPSGVDLPAGTDILLYEKAGVLYKINAAGISSPAATGEGGGSGGIYDISVGVPALSTFTQVDTQSFMSFSERAAKALVMTIVGSTPGHSNVAGLSKPVPSTPYTVSMLVLHRSNLGMYNGLAFGWHDPVSGKLDLLIADSNSYGSNAVEHHNYPDTQSRSNLGAPANWNYSPYEPIWLHLTDDGTNVTWASSGDGAIPIPFLTIAKAGGYLGGAYSNIFVGFFPYAYGGTSFIGCGLNIYVYDEAGAVRHVGP